MIYIFNFVPCPNFMTLTFVLLELFNFEITIIVWKYFDTIIRNLLQKGTNTA